MMSMSRAGSHRVDTAHITSCRSRGSTSASTVMTNRFMYAVTGSWAAKYPACLLCPA